MVRTTILSLMAAACLGCGGGGDGGTDARDAQDAAGEMDAAVDAAEAGDEFAVDEVGGDDLDGAGELDVADGGLPRALPFAFTRPPKGEPIPAEEVTAFTRKVTGMWKQVDWFRWVLRTSTGVDPSTGKEDYLGWYNDVLAVKAGDTVTFKQEGGDHNMWIPGSKVLSEAMAGCTLTGDWTVCKVAEQYCKGLTAVVKGFIWDEADPAPYLMARAIFPMDQAFTLDAAVWQDDGRKKVVEYHDMYHVEDGWNAHTFAWPHNPTWGSMWVTNMRSKDDVCAIVRTTTFLPYVVADAPFPWVAEACQETLDNMKGFNQDIVDHNYNIRTKDADGKAREVTEEDLGSYVWYVGILGPESECTNRLATDLIAYGKPLTGDCGLGFPSSYEEFATAGHYYNYPIVWNYHMAALGNALVYGAKTEAWDLLNGLALRLDAYLSPNTKEPGAKDPDWGRDMAVLLVQAASVGLPLKADEARHVQKHWSKAVEEFEAWQSWDLWAETVPDGEYWAGGGFRPSCSPEGIPVEAVTMLLEYCSSPFRNPAGAAFVDCEVVADIAHWGEQ